MELIINRESVCLTDDVENHKRTFVLSDKATYEELFKKLLEEKFFPYISGNNVVWVLTSKQHSTLFSYYTLTGKILERQKCLNEICGEEKKLLFRYYSSPSRWKDCITESYHGNISDMWKDDVMEECKYCDYVVTLGNISLRKN